MATDFSIQATQISPVQNAVTPQAGAVDQSGAIIGKAIAGAIGPAVELYGTVKEQDFKREAEKEFRMNLGYTADPLGQQYEPKSPGEKELDQLADRASQMGVMGVGDNAALVLAARARAKIAKEPWFAERYKRAAGQINEEYAQTLQLLDAAAARAAANMSEAEKILAKKRESVYTHAAAAGISFTKPIDLMDEQELIAADQQALLKTSELAHLDEYRATKREERAVRADERAEERLGFSRDEFQAGQTDRGREAFATFNNNVMAGREAYYSQKLTDTLYSFIDSGLLTTNPAEAQNQFNAGSTRILANILTELNKPIIDPNTGQPVFLDRKSIDDTYRRLVDQVDRYRESFYGKGSNADVVASQAKALKDRYNLDILKDPVLGKIFSYPFGIQESIVASLRLTENDMPELKKSIRGLLTTNDKAQAISSVMQGNPVDPALNNVATAASIAGIDPAIAMQDPQVFQNFLSQVAGEVSLINRNERPKAYLKIVRPEIANVVGNLPNPETATENIRKVAQQQIEDLQRDIGPLIGNLRYGKDGVFVSTDQRANNTAAALNGVMGVLEIVDKHGTIRYGSRDELAKKFFNVNIGTAPAQVEADQ